MSNPTVKISLRIDGAVHASLEVIAGKEAMSTEALIQRILTLHVIGYAREAGIMAATEIDRLERERGVIEAVIRRALELNEQGKFTEHFTLTVFRDLIADTAFRSNYETVIGGDAYESGLPGKFPLNMNLGRYIKNAIPGAAPLRDPNGRPRRVQVRNEPVQSYTLLTKAGGQ